MRAIRHLFEPVQAHKALMSLWPLVKNYLLAGHRLELEVRPERRGTAANARFHAICTDLERSRLPWFGKPRTDTEWKVLLVSGHSVVTKHQADVVPGLEGELVNLRESTALMSKPRSASLIEYSEAFCIANDVPLHDPQPMEAP